ncbi:EAL domain-containing protein [Erwinia aphidicola]|uniref:EAL domain-containing protein n=1 Tax=Erwinia aphidicola TaxID=68334 RepID=UPI003AB57984
MERLKHLGVTISLDDFGVGYSGTACLTSLPPDAVKLHRSVVAAVSGSREAETAYNIRSA